MQHSVSPNARRPPTFDYGKIDERVRGLVQSFRLAGLRTTSSCQGGEGHGFDLPTIRLEYRKDKGYAKKIIKHMMRLGIPCTVSCHIPIQAERVMHSERFYQVELWSLEQLGDCPEFKEASL